MASGCRTGCLATYCRQVGLCNNPVCQSQLYPPSQGLWIWHRDLFHGNSNFQYTFLPSVRLPYLLDSFVLFTQPIIGLLNLSIYWCWWQALLLPHPERGLRPHGPRGLRRALAAAPFEEEATKMISKVVFSFPFPVVNVYIKQEKTTCDGKSAMPWYASREFFFVIKSKSSICFVWIR